VKTEPFKLDFLADSRQADRWASATGCQRIGWNRCKGRL